MSENKPKPFSKNYVVNMTRKKMLDAINLSITKTTGRIEEFSNNQEKSLEIIETLSYLHSLKKTIEGLSNENTAN